jgi:hypothetical protein
VRCASMIILSLPSALNQHPIGAIGVMRIFAFTTVLAVMAYLLAFVAFLIFTSLFMRRSFRTLHGASSVIGVAIFAFVATMYCVVIIPGRVGEIIEGCLMIAVWFAAFVLSIRILRRGDPPADARSMVGGAK